ncbi:hypothetical protein PMAYCL1PPCAC_10823, partial [Pristionchus mayeri]
IPSDISRYQTLDETIHTHLCMTHSNEMLPRRLIHTVEVVSDVLDPTRRLSVGLLFQSYNDSIHNQSCFYYKLGIEIGRFRQDSSHFLHESEKSHFVGLHRSLRSLKQFRVEIDGLATHFGTLRR